MGLKNFDRPKSRRRVDSAAAEHLGLFLQRYLYPAVVEAEHFSRVEFVHNKADQLDGVDVRFTRPDGTVCDVDEKAQLYGINKGRPFFPFEIQFLRGQEETVGWFCNQSLLTDYYLLIWPYATQDTPEGIRWYHFTKAECLLVEKEKLLDRLREVGLTPESMVAAASELRRDGYVGRKEIPGVPGIYYSISDPHKSSEAPINIVIDKQRLLTIAHRRYIVTKEGVETL